MDFLRPYPGVFLHCAMFQNQWKKVHAMDHLHIDIYRENFRVDSLLLSSRKFHYSLKLQNKHDHLFYIVGWWFDLAFPLQISHFWYCSNHWKQNEKQNRVVFHFHLGPNRLPISLKAELRQDINRVSLFSRCLDGTFPWRNCSVKTLIHYPKWEE